MLKLRFARQFGITLVLALPLIIALLLVVTFVLSLSFRARERSRLQVASDTSAQAASAVMCSSKTCWESARRVAIETLRANAKLGSEVQFAATDMAPNGSALTHWESAGYSIDIERGQYLPKIGFTSMEDSWQSRNPGKPVPLVQNAVRIEISRSIIPFFNLDSTEMLSASGRTTALAQKVERVCAAPFAIPACALLNDNGEVDKKQLCLADRVFTATNRYCPPENPNCQVMPDFDYEPLVIPPGLDWSLLFGAAHGMFMGGYDISCFFATPRYNNVADNFGVVGLPGDTVSAELIELALKQPGGCREAFIGQPFSVLEDGLTSAELGDAVWNQITNAPNGGVEDGTHLPYGQVSAKAGFNHISLNDNRAFTHPVTRTLCDQIAASGGSSVSSYGVRPSYGVCNSRRTSFGQWGEYNQRSIYENLLLTCPYNDTSFDQLAWRVQIPVIAEPGQTAAACAGTLQTSNDPQFNGSRPQEIVGFVTVVIYDADVGAPPPSLSDFHSQMQLGARYCTEIGEPHTPPNFPIVPPPAASATFPFGFVGAGSTSTPCNAVRARIDCNSTIIASAFDSERNEPSIVE